MGDTHGFNVKMKALVLNQPVLVISGIVASIGLILPLVVPPLREALYKSEQPPNPNLKSVVANMTGKPPLEPQR